MRPPFKVEINNPSINPDNNLVWRELSFTPLRLHLFFEDVLGDTLFRLAKQDGQRKSKDFDALSDYGSLRTQAADIAFGDRQGGGTAKVAITQSMSVASPFIRLRQSPEDVGRGMFGHHVGVLWDAPRHKIVGVSILKRNLRYPNNARLWFWKRPSLGNEAFVGAMKAFMDWSTKPANAGFKHFMTDIAVESGVREDASARINLAKQLGLKDKYHYKYDEEVDDDDKVVARPKRVFVLAAKNWRLKA